MNKTANRKHDSLEKYRHDRFLQQAKVLLQSEELTEEAYLGAQAVLLINGLI